ncbi:bacillithiol biosynthesis cysteine-adding enzyme BshC [Bacillus sp. B15-48]|uniref:bacillithiol biosynthesis cysteine-adding enzyme BshC n=1 Tax=Bacillus sp. B15-48 TaxID=1548601 RepID=UPI00193EF41F|nr:bacillithiol biosynthesis cysteine-adding enzyme BshC [Bacillus sp. B15-48]MBM4764031.1 bacillithiol biosynthesis cysteine-adding enzyme BshC [Bacillus sp. B15-48]
MEILNLSLPAVNRFATGYLGGSEEIQSFFHYNYQKDTDYTARLEELKKRTFYRQELSEHIRTYMSRFPSSEQVRKNIERLKLDNSVAVIGGQQAGLLTGPLYSVHKVISIIKLAEQKEQELGIPVIPVFWIAGEDHDYQEVNHVYVLKNNKPEKWIYPDGNHEKSMVTDIEINKEACLSWIEDIIGTFGETCHTNDLREFAKSCLASAQSFVDFFATIIMEMFKDHGLLIVDSGNQELRQLEKDFFMLQIRHHKEITKCVLDQQKEIQKVDFNLAIDLREDGANLFYNDIKNKERILLRFEDQTNLFTEKNGEISFSLEELMTIATEYPERLSNNVVTRPLMQEWLFPTLAFIGGPGEIAYWAELKLVFEYFDLKMPPLVPRLNITILDRSIETDLYKLNLDLQDVLETGTSKYELKFIDSLKDRDLEELFVEMRNQLVEQYKFVRAKTEKVDKGLLPLLTKNEDILINQIEFMERKIYESVCRKHDDILLKFTRIENALRPSGSPQERVWNPFYYMNVYGLDFFTELVKLPLSFDGKHKVIKR